MADSTRTAATAAHVIIGMYSNPGRMMANSIEGGLPEKGAHSSGAFPKPSTTNR